MIAVVHITATPPGTFAGNVDWFTVKHPDYAPHDLVDPSTHEEMQFVPYDQPSKALLNQPGGVETNNRVGGVYQVEVVADEYCTSYSDQWYAWLDQWLRAKSIALSIPYIIYPGIDRFSFAQWTNSDLVGFYRHINVPENDHRCSWLLDLTRLAQPPTSTPQDDDMIRYILRFGPDLNNQPWLGVYDSGKVRYLGPVETAHLRGPDPNHPLVPFIDETQRTSYDQAKLDAGIPF